MSTILFDFNVILLVVLFVLEESLSSCYLNARMRVSAKYCQACIDKLFPATAKTEKENSFSLLIPSHQDQLLTTVPLPRMGHVSSADSGQL